MRSAITLLELVIGGLFVAALGAYVVQGMMQMADTVF